jgi:hypothetical protein
MSDTDNDTITPPTKESNEDRKRKALLAKATKSHEWRVQVWAQMERRIQSINAELAVIGADPYEPYEADFDDVEKLAHYATMTLPK